MDILIHFLKTKPSCFLSFFFVKVVFSSYFKWICFSVKRLIPNSHSNIPREVEKKLTLKKFSYGTVFFGEYLT